MAKYVTVNQLIKLLKDFKKETYNGGNYPIQLIADNEDYVIFGDDDWGFDIIGWDSTAIIRIRPWDGTMHSWSPEDR